MSVKNNFSTKKYYSFPCPWTVISEEGVVAVGGDLSAELLIESYSLGIFPWPHEDYPLLWFCPEERGVLEFNDLHISRSLQKWLQHNRNLYHIRVNLASKSIDKSTDDYDSVKNFEIVMQQCESVKRKGQAGSWITEDMKKSYSELFKTGHALSVECWKQDQLVAGLYGVLSNNYFSAESMFHLQDNTSKLVFIETVNYLKSQGHAWMDIQMVTPITESFGGKYISKKEFLKRIDCPKY